MNCQYCGKDISDKALMCPQCGQPVAGNLPNVKGMMENSKKMTLTILNAVFWLIVVVGLFILYVAYSTGIYFLGFFGIGVIVLFWFFKRWYAKYLEGIYGSYK